MFLRRFGPPVLALGALVALTTTARANPILYATSLEGQTIDRVDLGTNSVTPVVNPTFGQPDSLIFAPGGNIVYSSISAGTIQLFNVTTHTDMTLASGLAAPQDLELDPGGTTVTFSNAGPGQVERVSLSGGGASLLHTYGGNTTGLVYDPLGRLFLNVDNGGGSINQIDPTTGAVLHSSMQSLPNLDGLTYDPFTHLLYATALGTSQIYAIDPNTLVATLLPNSGVPRPDGVVADGLGHLFVASRGDFHIYEYDLGTNQLTQRTMLFGLDDLAPLVGLGAPTPEPSTLLLMGSISLGMVGYRWYRRQRAA
jgi:DNA-binding beta-propeller fold protein YncE